MKLEDRMYAEFWSAYKFMRESEWKMGLCRECGSNKEIKSNQFALAKQRMEGIYQKIRQAEQMELACK